MDTPGPADRPLTRADITAIVEATVQRLMDQTATQQQVVPALAPWKAEELGFFYPDLADQDCTGSGDVVTTGRDTYYRDVFVFIDRIKDFVIVKSEDVLKANLHTCL